MQKSTSLKDWRGECFLLESVIKKMTIFKIIRYLFPNRIRYVCQRVYIRFLSVSQTAATATAKTTTTTAFRQRVVCKTSQQRYHNANNKHDDDGNNNSNNTRTVLCFKRKIRLAPLKDQTRTRIAKAQALKAEISTFKKKPKKSHETKVNKGPNVEPKDDHELPCSIKEIFVIIKRLLKRCSRFLTLERRKGGN